MMKQENSIITCDLIDRISDLHDSILGKILSFLPTKNVVETALVSKRWRHAWMTVCSLDFCHKGLFKQDDEDEIEVEDMKFVRFVDHVLLLGDVGSLNKFRLAWNPMHISSSYARSWISSAIKRNVHEISLRVTCSRKRSFSDRSIRGPINVAEQLLPLSLFSCDSLRYLELDGRFFVSSAAMVCLPRLEILKLAGIVFECETTFEKLINKCPMLNCLHYLHSGGGRRRKRNNPFTCRISSTCLKRLELDFKSDCSLNLEAPSLEYFRLYGFTSEILVQRNLSSLVEADFEHFQIPPRATNFNSLAEAICAFDHAKALTLSVGAIRVLSCATISLSTEFKRLVKLVAETDCGHCSSLQDLIQSSNNLQVIQIFQHSRYVYENKSDVYDSKWTTPVEVPRCLSNSLKKVVIDGFKGSEDDREKILYMLKHGSVLEEMKIFITAGILKANSELVQEICTFPRRSAACEVQFFVKSNFFSEE